MAVSQDDEKGRFTSAQQCQEAALAFGPPGHLVQKRMLDQMGNSSDPITALSYVLPLTKWLLVTAEVGGGVFLSIVYA